MSALKPDVIDFLLSTAVLSRLSGELCDDVLGVNGSGAVLEQLARDNRFVIPLDRHGGWYRYHHLFGEVLNQEMCARDLASVRAVARRASTWFEQRGELEAAVEHALTAQDEHAPSLIWRLSPRMLATNRSDTVARWLAHYAEAEIERVPELALTAAWQKLTVGDMAAVHRYAEHLATAPDHCLPDGSNVSAAVALLSALTRIDGLSAMRGLLGPGAGRVGPRQSLPADCVLPGGDRGGLPRRFGGRPRAARPRCPPQPGPAPRRARAVPHPAGAGGARGARRGASRSSGRRGGEGHRPAPHRRTTPYLCVLRHRVRRPSPARAHRARRHRARAGARIARPGRGPQPLPAPRLPPRPRGSRGVGGRPVRRATAARRCRPPARAFP